MAPAHVAERARAVRLLVLDVDGVLTDGTLLYGPSGEELKAFSVRDGLGITLARKAGVEVAVISGRSCPALERRLADLRVGRASLGRRDKVRALDALLEVSGHALAEVACVGDDLLDLPLFSRVGLAVAVADAEPAVRAAAHWVTERPGGRGAVREVCEGLLAARGVLEQTVAAHLEALAR